MEVMDLLDHLITEVEDKINRLKDYTISGAANDHSDYTRLVGRYEILVEMHTELITIRGNLIDS